MHHPLGRGLTNYDIQIIVVILKVITRFFQQRPWIIGKNCHDSFGVTQVQYELRGLLWFRFGRADSIVNDDDIGLSEHLVIMIVLKSHMFSAKFTTVVFRKNDYHDENFHRCFLNPLL